MGIKTTDEKETIKEDKEQTGVTKEPEMYDIIDSAKYIWENMQENEYKILI